MDKAEIREKLLAVMPLWNFQVAKPFRKLLGENVSISMYYCLRALQWNGGNGTMSDLASWSKMPKQQTTKIVNRLAYQGFVVRREDPGDRRVVQIELTEKGSQFIDRFLAAESQNFSALLDGMSEATLKDFGDGLDLIYGALANVPGVRSANAGSLHVPEVPAEYPAAEAAAADHSPARRMNVNKKIIQLGLGVFPTPNLIVSCRRWDGRNNALDVGFACNASMDPGLVMIGIVPEHYSYELIKKAGEFVINIPTKGFESTFEYLGNHSGRDGDKFAAANVQWTEGTKVWAPVLTECPINAECKVTKILEPGGDHEFFVGSIEAVHCWEDWLDEDGSLDLSKMVLL